MQMNGNEQVWDTAGTHNGQDVVIMGGGWELEDSVENDFSIPEISHCKTLGPCAIRMS